MGFSLLVRGTPAKPRAPRRARVGGRTVHLGRTSSVDASRSMWTYSNATSRFSVGDALQSIGSEPLPL